MKKILVAEDEEVIRDFIVINLRRAGYEIIEVENGEQALKKFDEHRGDFDIALLDVMMPGIDGFEVCKQIRSKSDSIGIIMLSAKTQEMDKVTGLMLGADDYVTKPFSPTELLARVDSVHRRVTMFRTAAIAAAEILSEGSFMLNLRNHTLTKNGKHIDLTHVEFQIMELLLRKSETAVDRAVILKEVWGDTYYGDLKIVDVNIRRLRLKIENNPSDPKHILTVWGVGYKWSK